MPLSTIKGAANAVDELVCFQDAQILPLFLLKLKSGAKFIPKTVKPAFNLVPQRVAVEALTENAEGCGRETGEGSGKAVKENRGAGKENGEAGKGAREAGKRTRKTGKGAREAVKRMEKQARELEELKKIVASLKR